MRELVLSVSVSIFLGSLLGTLAVRLLGWAGPRLWYLAGWGAYRVRRRVRRLAASVLRRFPRRAPPGWTWEPGPSGHGYRDGYVGRWSHPSGCWLDRVVGSNHSDADFSAVLVTRLERQLRTAEQERDRQRSWTKEADEERERLRRELEELHSKKPKGKGGRK